MIDYEAEMERYRKAYYRAKDETERETVAALAKVLRDAANADEWHPFLNGTVCMSEQDIRDFADWLESGAWKRGRERGDG